LRFDVEAIRVDKVTALIDRGRALGLDVTIAGPAPETAVRQLEEVFGHEMPPSYREFLAQFGGLAVQSRRVSGVTDGQIDGALGRAWYDTRRARERWRLPAELLVLEPDDEEPACLDFARRGWDGEPPVVRFHRARGLAPVSDPSFDVWLVAWLWTCVEEWCD
jgi:hypothetical protein